MTTSRLLMVCVLIFLTPFVRAQPPATADDFTLVQAEDPKICTVEGRVETHIYPRSVGRKMAMLHPGSRLSMTTEMTNVSIILPPVFESPGPRYGNFLASRLRDRVDDQPWRELALATARPETIVGENLPAGKHTITVEPMGGLTVVDAFRLTKKPMAGLVGTVVSNDYSELLTDVRMDVFQGQRLVRTEYVRHPRTGDFEIFALPAGDYRVRIVTAGWNQENIDGLKIKGPGHRLDVGTIVLKREPRCGGGDTQDRPVPRFGHSVCATPGSSFMALVNLAAAPIKRAQLQSHLKSLDVAVIASRKLPIGRWNDVGEATFQLPKDIPWDMYDLVLSFDTKQGEVRRIAGQAVCVRPPLPEQYHVAGCGHMNTWGQQTAEYLARVAEVAELAGARTLLIANEVNAAYVSGALVDLRIPYVVTAGNHTMPRWSEFFGASSRAHDDGSMRIVDFGRWPYESWAEVESHFRSAPKATNRVIVCYESFAPIALIREQKINLLFDAHTDDVHAERKEFPPRTFQMRAPTQETLRWIPMTHQGLARAVNTKDDVPVLSIPRTGPSPLRVTFERPNDGTPAEQVATITNDFVTEFPQARLRLVLRRGVYRITGATVLQTFDSDDATRTVLDLDFRVPGKSVVLVRANMAVRLNGGPTRPHADAKVLQNITQLAAEAKLLKGQFDERTRQQFKALLAKLTDAQVRRDAEDILPALEQAAFRYTTDRALLAEIKRLGGKATIEVFAPDWLRSITGDDALPVFGRLVEIELNERTDGHKDPVPKKLSDRVSDDWLKNLAGQDQLRRLELSGTAITSAGLVHLKELRNIERLNVCLTAVDDRGFEHLAGMTKMKRIVLCASKITGSGFQRLQGMKQIESINLHSAPAGDAGLEAIGKLTTLRRLEIVHTKVTDAGLKHLAKLIHVQQLHVHGPETTATALPFLGQLQELYELDVYDRAASNQTLEQIAKLSKLRLLMLVNGTFDDDSVRHLAKLNTLEELSIDSSRITEASIEHLAGLQNLRKLQLGRTRVTPAGRQRLKELLPKVVMSP